MEDTINVWVVWDATINTHMHCKDRDDALEIAKELREAGFDTRVRTKHMTLQQYKALEEIY